MSIVSSRLKQIRKQREEETKKRKSFLPVLLFTAILWAIFALILLFIDPDKKGSLELFVAVFFSANLFTFSLLLGSLRRGFLVSSAITLFVFLRYLGVGNLLNLLLITGATVAFEFYLSKRP